MRKVGSANRPEGRFSAVLSSLTAAALLAISATHANPAYYHDMVKNRQPCSDCHTLHYSEAGQAPTATPGAIPVTVEAGGPFSKLLVQATTNKLCLFCHDGSDPNAPDVLADDQGVVTMYAVSGDEHSGAGFFANSGGTSNDNGHDLGLNKSSPPFSSMTNVTLTCASCHDPHGTLNYRNILTAPAGGTGVSVEPGADKDVVRNVPPGDPPSASATISAYKKSNLGYKSDTSKWCTECHDILKPHIAATARTENHHLVDVPINGTGYPTDPAHWVGGTGSGFGTTTGDSAEGVPRLRIQVPGATDFPTSQAVAANNQVMCSSCHLAHGGKHKKGLVWPNKDSGGPVDKDSGCQQCHNF